MLKRVCTVVGSLVAIIVTLLSLDVLCSRAYAGVVPDDEWSDEAKLWLARSVLGEAGWKRPDEYSAIAYVYATRAEQTGRYDFLGMVKQYSAAVRAPGKRRNPWLFELGFDKTRPPSWPMGPQWPGLHDEAWFQTLEWADAWQAGEHENPCPGANHFGSYQDSHRASNARWMRIRCKVSTRNRFYTSLRLRQERQGRQ